MVIQNLKSVIASKGGINNKDFLRNLLKEELQVFVLNFIYTSPKYKNLIFTGGTCLRKFYQLPRISEDLDFDYEGSFDFDLLQKDLKKYFEEEIQYKDLYLKFKNQTIFLKFPVLKEIGFSGESDTDILFLRLDFSKTKGSDFNTEKLLFSSYDFSFLAKTFDFSTLISNKIAAFLTRDYRKGNKQSEPFKGRDMFDLVWMFGEAKKMGKTINLKQLNNLIGIASMNEASKKILEKAENIESKDLFNDLRGFFEDLNFVSDFCQNFKLLLKSNLENYMAACKT